ncbi:MAG TPA: FAD-binding oxidoreductase, partial [Candidatus Binatia bacterium]|nr:FAD-binding oxidoreductase [Candidatus Binatia bacterium]
MSENVAEPVVPPKSSPADVPGLSEALRAQVRGDVRFDTSSRALYATDGSNYRQVPIGVVLPRDADDVLAAISVCRDFSAPLLCRGGGTSLAGQCCNVAVVLDFTKYMGKILEIDPERRIARVQPGVVLDHLRNAAEKHHLTFAPDPASHDRCTIGGMIGNNSCGVHSVMAGKTDDNIEALEVVLYDGSRLKLGQNQIEPCGNSHPRLSSGPEASGRSAVDRAVQIHNALKQIADQYGDLVRKKFPNIPRRVSGYNLNYLLPENGFHVARALVGSEGTCATTLEATCRLVESPPARVLLVVAYPDIYQCADHIPEILEYKPIGLEGFDDLLVYYGRTKGINQEGLALLPEGGGWLMVEFGAESLPGAELQAQRLIDALRRSTSPPNVKLYSGARAKRIWEVRESSLGATSHVPGEPFNWEGWEDAAVSPEKLGGYLRDLRKMMAEFNYKGSLYGHFGHACVHTRLNFDLQS